MPGQDGAARLGLSIFLGEVAIASDRPFVDTLASQGPAVLLAVHVVLASWLATVLVVGQRAADPL